MKTIDINNLIREAKAYNAMCGGDRGDVVEALWWLTGWYYSGQGDPLYTLHYALGRFYSPGPDQRGPCSIAGDICKHLESINQSDLLGEDAGIAEYIPWNERD